jgi:hypothetical protein
MIAAEDEWQLPVANQRRGSLGDIAADTGDCRQEVDAAFQAQCFARWHRNIASVDDGVAKLFQSRREARQPHGGWAHLDAPAGRAEIEWNAE